MLINNVSLTDSVNLSAIKTDKFKTGILTFTLTVPLDKDTYLYSLLLSGLLRRGTKKFTTMASINRRLDELYASCVEIRSSIINNSLLLIFTAEFLDDKYTVGDIDVLGGVIEIISEMILFPNVDSHGFNSKFLEQELRFVKDSLKSEKNNTRTYAATKCNELINRYNGNYPTIEGLLEKIEKIAASEIYDYYKYIISSSVLDIFYIGNTDINIVSSKIKKSFEVFNGKIRSTVSAEKYSLPPDFIAQKESLPVSQSKLSLGFNTQIDILSDKYYSMLVLNEILGGSSASKLFINVREKMNICYYCSSSYSIYSGIILVSCGINADNYSKAKKAILEQLKEIQCGNIDEQELISAKKALENCYVQIYDNPLEIQAFYGGRSIVGKYENIDDCKKRISAVTLNDIVAVSQDIHLIAEFFVEGHTEDGGACEEECDD